ncbi:AAA family ATPase [Paenarthrobacter sp. FR1]|uniref:ATP-binding protein n=1 Tax=Paenarthrobacter sp. FR1 TaxID=3439548 RepID=UPI003DA46F2B
MDSDLNPFSPGSGLKPPALEGRQAEIDAFDRLIVRTKRQASERGILLSGLRGVGKTVLLNNFAAQAERHEWFVVQIEAQPSPEGRKATRQKLARAIEAGARRLRAKSAWSSVKDVLGSIGSFSVTLGFTGVTATLGTTPGRADSGNLDIDLEELVEDIAMAMAKNKAGFGMFIDEMQDLDDELLGALISVQHLAGQKSWPFFIIGAGLPNLPGKLSATRSYSERLFDYRVIGALDHASAADAIGLPMNKLGAHLDSDALRALVAAAEGYPFFLQAYGKAAWDVASSKRVNLDDARLAIEIGTEQLDAGFFIARWQRATPAERQYLRAMAEDNDEASSTATVAARLKRAASQLTVARANLIAKGLIYAPDHGAVRFTVPGMSGFISRQYED